MKLEFSRQIFEKYSNKNFRGNPYIGSRGVPFGEMDGQIDRQTDRYDEGNCRFLRFCERAQKFYVLLTVRPGTTLGK